MREGKLEVHHVYIDGILQVDPKRMKNVKQDATLEEQRRIIANRWEYLSWMQHHFAPKVVKPQSHEG